MVEGGGAMTGLTDGLLLGTANGAVDAVVGGAIEFLQPGGSTSSRAAATAVELQFAL